MCYRDLSLCYKQQEEVQYLKNISVRDKKEFDNINTAIKKMDESTKIYLLGYIQGLNEKNSISKILVETTKK